jgi:SAM-dependent methyltransferase
MNSSKKNLKNFYDNYYSMSPVENPALLIYDRLRINKIKKEVLNYYSNGKVLIIGCGSKRDSEIMDFIEDSFAFDLSLNAVKRIQSFDRKLFVADASYLPFANNQFDLVIISEVIEHIPDVQIVTREIFRVEEPLGKLILTTPNWNSFFGLFRWIAKILFNKTITSDDQPYDDWKTIKKLKIELSPYFSIIYSSGIWYLPPLHYKNKGLSHKLTNILYKIFSPFEKFLSSSFPHLGHLLFIVFISNK